MYFYVIGMSRFTGHTYYRQLLSNVGVSWRRGETAQIAVNSS